MSLSEYRELNPNGALFSHGLEKEEHENGLKHKEEPKPVIIGSNLVLSSRIKPLEELPPIANEKTEAKEEKSMYDNMLSPYNNVPNAKEKQRRNSKSPKPKEIELNGK